MVRFITKTWTCIQKVSTAPHWIYVSLRCIRAAKQVSELDPLLRDTKNILSAGPWVQVLDLSKVLDVTSGVIYFIYKTYFTAFQARNKSMNAGAFHLKRWLKIPSYEDKRQSTDIICVSACGESVGCGIRVNEGATCSRGHVSVIYGSPSMWNYLQFIGETKAWN